MVWLLLGPQIKWSLYLLLQLILALQPDGSVVSHCFRRCVKIGQGEGGIGWATSHHTTDLVACDDGANLFPSVGAVGVAVAQGEVLNVAKLGRDKHWGLTLAAEGSAPGFRSDCSGEGLTALYTSYVQHDPLWGTRVMNCIVSLSRKISQNGSAIDGRQNPEFRL
jgi:hypothetical protein